MASTELPRIPALDALRGIAATAVVVFHAAYLVGLTAMPGIGFWFLRLDVFVSVFFVLSGFVLFRPYAHAKATGTRAIGAVEQYKRRFLRLVPAYWLLIIAAFLILPEKPLSWQLWLQHLTFTQYYVPGGFQHGVGQSWSLTVEIVFYLLLPFLALLTLGRRWRPRRTFWLSLLLIPVTIAWTALIATGFGHVLMHDLWFPAAAGCFGAGMALATAHVALRTGTASARWRAFDTIGAMPWRCLAFAVVLYAIVASPVGGPQSGLPTGSQYPLKTVLYLAISVCLTAPFAFSSQTRLHRFLGTSPVQRLGTVSYGLFLWHPFVLVAVAKINGPYLGRSFFAVLAIAMFGGLILATLSWYLIERPAINLGRSRTRDVASRKTATAEMTIS